jgi:4-amino-4-deoxy-L-arabinose transferase-like glycosyltransferase
MHIGGTKRYRWLADIAWLLALGVFVVAGSPLATFHGDETNQIYGSRDFAAVFLDGQSPRALMVNSINETAAAYLRIVHGSVGRYSIGLGWTLAGLDQSVLPPSGYRYNLGYYANIDNGTHPSGLLLTSSRFFPALFLALSVAWMFGLGKLFGGRPLAYFVSGLYAVNPVILLHGRRALQEGPLLCFGLLTILIAAQMSRQRADDKPLSWRWWLALTVAAALTLASKNSGFIFIASAFGWLWIGEVVRRRWREAALMALKLVGAGLVTVAMYWAISPGMWSNDPVQRIHDVFDIRSSQMAGQVRGMNNGPSPMDVRIRHIIVEPFMTPVVHTELRSWFEKEEYQAEISQYMNSPLSGLQFGSALGLLLTLLEGIGLLVALVPRLRPPAPASLYAGLLVWLAVNVIVLLGNPLPWQRYFLPFIPAATVLNGIGLWGLVHLVVLAAHRRPARAAAPAST